jgi:hypothetical protein
MPSTARPPKNSDAKAPPVGSPNPGEDEFVAQIEPKPVPAPATPVKAENPVSIPEKPAVHSSVPPADSELDRRNRKLHLVGIIFAWIIIFSSIGLFAFSRKTGRVSELPAPLPQPTAVPSPTPPVYTRSEYLIEVFNGSGIAGTATRIAGELESAGYSRTKIGSAAITRGTKVYFSPDFKFPDRLMADISLILNNASTGGELTGSTASARIVVGR